MKRLTLPIGFWMVFALSCQLGTDKAFGLSAVKYIRADVANLRKKPAANAALVFRVRMNDPVVEKKKQGEWSLVRFGPNTEGWLSSQWLGDSPLQASTLWKQFGAVDPESHPVEKPFFQVKTYPEVGLREILIQLNAMGHYGLSDDTYTALVDPGGNLLYPQGGEGCDMQWDLVEFDAKGKAKGTCILHNYSGS